MGAADPLFSLSCASTSVASIFPVAASAFEAAEMIPRAQMLEVCLWVVFFKGGGGVSTPKVPAKGSPAGDQVLVERTPLLVGTNKKIAQAKIREKGDQTD